MATKIIKKVVCDRCGKDCSAYYEKTFLIKDDENEKIKEIITNDNQYRYTEVTMQGYDSRFQCGSEKFDLCGNCVAELSKWLTNPKTNDIIK